MHENETPGQFFLRPEHARVSGLCQLIAATGIVAAATDKNTKVVDDPAYTHAQRLVEIEPGRRLNLYCTGKGSPTVVFDSVAGTRRLPGRWCSRS